GENPLVGSQQRLLIRRNSAFFSRDVAEMAQIPCVF
ncbi:MAG: hypothetical protein ACJATG_001253, partial [Dinoroseobacter sp.]